MLSGDADDLSKHIGETLGPSAWIRWTRHHDNFADDTGTISGLRDVERAIASCGGKTIAHATSRCRAAADDAGLLR